MATVEKKLTSPVMCFCAVGFRPVALSMSTLNDCERCDGVGWVEAHAFTGDDEKECTMCGWDKAAHCKG